MAELVHRATGEQPRLPVVQRLLQYTDGNALYLRTVLAEVPSEQLQGAADHPWAVPGTLAAALQQQLAALPAPVRALTEAAAVLSVRAPLRTVGQLAGVDDTATALQPALTAQLMSWWPSVPSTPVMVAHALQRDAVLEGMAPGSATGAARRRGGPGRCGRRVAAQGRRPAPRRLRLHARLSGRVHDARGTLAVPTVVRPLIKASSRAPAALTLPAPRLTSEPTWGAGWQSVPV